MFPIKPKYSPKLIEALSIFIILIGLISYFIIRLGTVPHIPILLSILVLIAYGSLRKIPFQDLHNGLIDGAKTGIAAVFLFFLIGVLISSWMISGTIPMLIDTGFTLIGGTGFYAIVFSITALIGVSLGSSLTTTATIGVAFIGIGSAMDASLAITAGAIVSGAFFGDKMSPLSDTTNLASTIVNVDLFDHIKHLSLTTIPAFLISFVIYYVLSPNQTISIDVASQYQQVLAATGLLHWTAWIPILLLVTCTILKWPAFISISLSIITATFLAFFVNGIAWSDIWMIWFEGYTGVTGFEPVDSLLTKGGIQSMLFTISLVLVALGFGGLLFVTGIIPSLLLSFQERLKRARSIIVSTAATAIGINVLIGEQYLSIMLTGETYKGIYQKAGLSNKALSRTLEDAGTVINPLVPWSVCGVFIADVLGVSVLAYVPFAFFCLLSPIITILFGSKKAAIEAKV